MPKLPVTAILTTVALLGAGAPSASVIEFQTRLLPSAANDDLLRQPSAAAYQALVEGYMASAPSAGYCDTTPAAWDGLSNSATCAGPAGSVVFDITATFTVGTGDVGMWRFRVGPDFGLGGALFVDGVAVAYDPGDLWWAGDYANTGEIFAISLSLGAGTHVVEAYGLERCCDGGQQAQYLAPRATSWVTFSSNDGRNPIPEPATLALFGLGLATLGFARRR